MRLKHRNTGYYRRQADQALHQLHEIGPLVAASLVCVPHRCGHPRCRCAAGAKHPSWRLTYKAPGQKTVTVYVPVDLLPEVRQWVKQHRRLKKLVAAISAAQIALVRLHVSEKRRRPKPSA
jgi:hypothetical protein